MRAFTKLGAKVKDAAEHALPHMPSRGASSAGSEVMLATLSHPKSTIGAFHEFWHSIEESVGANQFMLALAKHLGTDRSYPRGAGNELIGARPFHAVGSLLQAVAATRSRPRVPAPAVSPSLFSMRPTCRCYCRAPAAISASPLPST